MSDKINLFVSYSHEDEKYLKYLKVFLTDENCPNINIWDDGKISPGTEWDAEIKYRLANSQIVLLFLSQTFLNSKYIDRVELKTALDSHEKGTSRVIPIFVRDCLLNNYRQITKLQGLPYNKQFLATMGARADSQYVLIINKLNEVASELLTDKNIGESLEAGDAQSVEAKIIVDLSHNKNIFLAIPDSLDGQARRKDFLYSAIGRKQYEDWPYEIVPSVEDIKKLSLMNDDDSKEFITSLIKKSVFAIHILMTADELDEGFDKLQYNLAKKQQEETAFFSNILWLPNSEISAKLDETLLMNPVISGLNYEQLFSMIENKNKEKENKINELRHSFSRDKMIYMFYDYDKDHNNDLRIKLKNELEKKDNVVVQFSIPGYPIEKDREELDRSEACCVFYGKSNPEWFIIRQSLLYDVDTRHKKILCIDDPDIDLKINRDVSKRTFDYIIRGPADFDNKLAPFLNGL